MIYSFINYSFINYLNFAKNSKLKTQNSNVFHRKGPPIEIIRPFYAVVNVTKVFLLNNVLVDGQPAFIMFMKMPREHVIGRNCWLNHGTVALNFGRLVGICRIILQDGVVHVAFYDIRVIAPNYAANPVHRSAVQHMR